VSSKPVSTPAATAPANDFRCQGLARRGITPCPPAGLELERIAVRDGTHGGVDEATLRAAGDAYLRVHALYIWAVSQDDAPTFLMSGAVVPPDIARTNIFRGELQIFSKARAASGKVRFDPMRTTAITLVPVPADLQAAARRQGLAPSPYAWVDNQAGPARALIDGRDGSRQSVLDIPPGEPHPILVFGQLKDDLDLGFIWFQGGIYGCLSTAELRATCQL
jgi:hypothetical protein